MSCCCWSKISDALCQLEPRATRRLEHRLVRERSHGSHGLWRPLDGELLTLLFEVSFRLDWLSFTSRLCFFLSRAPLCARHISSIEGTTCHWNMMLASFSRRLFPSSPDPSSAEPWRIIAEGLVFESIRTINQVSPLETTMAHDLSLFHVVDWIDHCISLVFVPFFSEIVDPLESHTKSRWSTLNDWCYVILQVCPRKEQNNELSC